MAIARVSADIDKEVKQKAQKDAQYIRDELAKSMAEANDPNTIWLSHDYVVEKLGQQRAARCNV